MLYKMVIRGGDTILSRAAGKLCKCRVVLTGRVVKKTDLKKPGRATLSPHSPHHLKIKKLGCLIEK
jgi:hypothetical protein